MLNNRLKSVLPEVVYPIQSAFVSNRVIFHNIFICQNIMRRYKRKNRVAKCSMKVDLRKAYDSPSWDFIKQMPEGLNFPFRFVHWVMTCVTTPSFSVSINGSLCGLFQGKKGFETGEVFLHIDEENE